MKLEKKAEKIEKDILKKQKKLLDIKLELYKKNCPDKDLDLLDALISEYGDMYARYIHAEEGLADVALRFSEKYHDKIERENEQFDASCPLCGSKMDTGGRGYDSVACHECEAVIFVKQITDSHAEYFLVNHGIPTIKGAIVVEVPIPEKYKNAIIPPALFSSKVYARSVREEMIKQIMNHGVILNIDECTLI
jgi:hypothetical protein